MADVLQKLGIQSSLTFIKHNLPESFSPPDFERISADYSRDELLRGKIAEMLSGGSTEKLYAAILLWTVDRPEAERVLGELKNDNMTPLLLPRTGGMGWIEASVKGAALDFFAGGSSVMGENWRRAEVLSDLSGNVSEQAESEGREFEKNSLPKWIDVLEARENPEKERILLSKINRLKIGSATEKLYAAVLLKNLNEPEHKEILESLLGDETIVTYGSGDVKLPTPVKMIADHYLNPQPPAEPPKNVIAKTFDWLNETFTKGNKENK